MPRLPNILFIMADQFRADGLGCVGQFGRTPHLDRIALEGWRFNQTFANSPTCIPSRLSLATGLYPHQLGVMDAQRCTLDPEFPNWMQAVEAAGYQTALFGKTHLHPHEGDLRDRKHLMHSYGLRVVDEITGPYAAVNTRSNMTDRWVDAGLFDAFKADLRDRLKTKRFVTKPSPLPINEYYDVYVGQRTADYLASLPVEEPWFCWVSFAGPHEPWDVPEPYASIFSSSDAPPPLQRSRNTRANSIRSASFASNFYSPGLGETDVARLRAYYAGGISLIDDQIGVLLTILAKRGETDNTLIVFTSDHGEMNGDHGLLYKSNFYDSALKVPLIVAPPKRPGMSSGKVSSALVELMDVGATIVDFAGANVPESEALSLRPLIETCAATLRPATLSELGKHACAVTPELKVEFDEKGEAVSAFDRLLDVNESTDVIDDPSYADRIAAIGTWRQVHYVKTPPPQRSAVVFDHEPGKTCLSRRP